MSSMKDIILQKLMDLRRPKNEEDPDGATVCEAIDTLIACCEFLLVTCDDKKDS